MIFATIAATVAAVWLLPMAWNWRRVSKVLANSERKIIAEAVYLSAGSDAQLVELMAKYPCSTLPAVRWAERPLGEKHWSEAFRRGEIICERFPKELDGNVVCLKALVGLADFDRAEKLAVSLQMKFPSAVEVYIEHAVIAHSQSHWIEADERWSIVRHAFPTISRGYVWGAIVLTKLEQLGAADELLRKAMNTLDARGQREVVGHYADLADRRRSWDEANQRWAHVRSLMDHSAEGYWRGSDALRQMGRLDEASKVLAPALLMFPTNAHVVKEAAELETQSNRC